MTEKAGLAHAVLIAQDGHRHTHGSPKKQQLVGQVVLEITLLAISDVGDIHGICSGTREPYEVMEANVSFPLLYLPFLASFPRISQPVLRLLFFRDHLS